nr:hypothetical protein [uncultured Psychroserpens sp.]
MDKYKTYYQHLETCQLVEIIEESHRYNAEVICYCKHLITNKNESIDSLKEMAKSHFTKRYFNFFRDGGHWTSKTIIYNSHFLTR